MSCENDFHRELASSLGMKEFYGCNLDALWDVISTGVERPVTLIWKNSQESKAAMGVPFERIQWIKCKVEACRHRRCKTQSRTALTILPEREQRDTMIP